MPSRRKVLRWPEAGRAERDRWTTWTPDVWVTAVGQHHFPQSPCRAFHSDPMPVLLLAKEASFPPRCALFALICCLHDAAIVVSRKKADRFRRAGRSARLALRQ